MDYIVASTKDWNKEFFDKESKSLVGNWYFSSTPDELIRLLESIAPRYIFFPHWSWIVPKEIFEKYECVCFHMTDLPFGRGGSPLQNLIVRGFTETKLTALKMEKELDAGPIYYKVDLSLEGSAQKIFERTSDKVYELIEKIFLNERKPTPQTGKVVKFSRRTPEQSEMSKSGDLNNCYNHIRMLDAGSYPKAFMNYGEFKLEFGNSHFNSEGQLIATVTISKQSEENKQ